MSAPQRLATVHVLTGRRPIVLDAGALIALESHGNRVAWAIERARAGNRRIHIPSGALAQAWRHGRRQTTLARLLKTPGVVETGLDWAQARRIGALLGITATTDVVDAQVAIIAHDLDAVVLTSDPRDLAALDPRLRLITV